VSVLRRARRRAGVIARWRPSSLMRWHVNEFHRLYYGLGRRGSTWRDTWWFGVPIMKSPLDLWIYQEILNETRPDVIIETGTARGGSALFLAMMCDFIGRGEVISIDIRATPGRPSHDRIRYFHGSSIDPDIIAQVVESVRNHRRVMVLLDSEHSREHVLRELESYSPLVTEGCYLIVEDTNVNGHPVWPHYGPGPMEAVDEFLLQHPDFARDEGREKFLMTFNPGGYLRRRVADEAPPTLNRAPSSS
jgi:cephalosporin hydroxylase